MSRFADQLQISSQTIVCAQCGDLKAINEVLSKVVEAVKPLALRFLGNCHDAEEACQEITLRVNKYLHTFKGDAKFSTWVYRVAVNQLISIKATFKTQDAQSFDDFEKTLYTDMSSIESELVDLPDYHRMLEEIRIACALAMLQCLGDDLRMAYLLGEILDFDQQEASEILSISTGTYRKRLSRARRNIVAFMSKNCGFIAPENPCRCTKQLDKCLKNQCISRSKFEFAPQQFDEKTWSQAQSYIQTINSIEAKVQAAYRNVRS
ncbi:RNA polymerase sigma factor [Pseudoalteromonas sp. S16_S37]|uniref:RNA polymerase sigma factor n=1 Tax=Pseudoalteromonas sp. S16_S37 TaxID=2720228 RepID=UPI00168025ED|nr:RNA polymerase sigma factor [Pseudoalteromonas sp. S16_S37]MBD1584427.1 RNA polymerase sigma factor [Pseudoalteromonas sp. S16_S37]